MNTQTDITRLMNHIKEHVETQLMHYLFEPNDQITQRQVRLQLTEYMQRFLDRRIINDFTVICSDENNPPSVVDHNQLVVDIEILPGHISHPNPIRIHGILPMATATVKNYSGGPAGYSGMTMTTAASGMITNTIKPRHELMLMSWLNGEPEIRFTGTENGKDIEALFTPERDISTFELMRINQMELAILGAALSGATHMLLAIDAIAYIRKHHLERHFKFKEI